MMDESFELSYLELKEKEVINIADGKKLGQITNIFLSLKGGISGVVVPSYRKLFKGSSDLLFIAWTDILKIGEDTIFVNIGNNLSFLNKSI